MSDEVLEYLRDMVLGTALDRYMLVQQMVDGDVRLLEDLMFQYQARTPGEALVKCEAQLMTASRLFVSRENDVEQGAKEWDGEDAQEFRRLKREAFTLRGVMLDA